MDDRPDFKAFLMGPPYIDDDFIDEMVDEIYAARSKSLPRIPDFALGAEAAEQETGEAPDSATRTV